MTFFKQSEGNMIYNLHGIPKQCPECGGGLIRKRINDVRKDLVCAMCGVLVGSIILQRKRQET
jgi:uncharacterized protein (DUF983 family)